MIIPNPGRSRLGRARGPRSGRRAFSRFLGVAAGGLQFAAPHGAALRNSPRAGSAGRRSPRGRGDLAEGLGQGAVEIRQGRAQGSGHWTGRGAWPSGSPRRTSRALGRRQQQQRAKPPGKHRLEQRHVDLHARTHPPAVAGRIVGRGGAEGVAAQLLLRGKVRQGWASIRTQAATACGELSSGQLISRGVHCPGLGRSPSRVRRSTLM